MPDQTQIRPHSLRARRGGMLPGEIVDVLLEELARTRDSTVPHLVQIVGRVGTGKTFAFQRFYDRLARQYASYWVPGLVPRWPPVDGEYVHRSRRVIVPDQALRDTDQRPDFLWIGVNAPGNGQDGDAIASLIHQLHLLIYTEVSRLETMRARADWAISAVTDLVAQFNPTISAIKLALDRLKGLNKLLYRSNFNADGQREMHDMLRSYARARELLGIKQIPMVVVLDDASMASGELLGWLNALIRRPEPGTPLSSDGAEESESDDRYLISQLDEIPPLPTILIAATWPDMSPAAKTAPVNHWIKSFRKLGLQIALCETRSLNAHEASELLSSPNSNLLTETGEELLRHVTRHGGDQVNALALVGALGEIQARRDPFTGAVDLHSVKIDELPSTAAQVMASRLSRARERTWGQAAIAVTKMMALVGGVVPWELIRILSERHEEIELAIFDILNQERFAAFSAETYSSLLPLDLIRVDPELSEFLASDGIADDERTRLANAISELFETWIPDLERGLYCSTYDWQIRRRNMRSLGQYARDVLPAQSRPALMTALTKPDMAYALAVNAPEVQAAIYLFTGGKTSESLDAVFYGALGLLPSPVGWHSISLLMGEKEFVFTDTMLAQTVDVARQSGNTAEQRRLLTKLLLFAGDTERALEVAYTVERYDGAVVGRVVRELLRQDRADEALDLLSRFPANGNACIKVAKILSLRGDLDAAVMRLESLAYSNWLVAGFYAELLKRNKHPDKARELLRFWSGRNAPAALHYSRLLMEDGDRPGALRLLDRFADHEPELALELARVYWRNGDYLAAIMTVGRCPAGFSGTASTVASLLNDIGDRGLKFRADGADLHQADEAEPEDVSRIDSDGSEVVSVSGSTDIGRFLRGARGLSSEELLSLHGVPSQGNSWLAQGLAEALMRQRCYEEARTVLRYHPEHPGVSCTLAELEVRIDGADGLEAARRILNAIAVTSTPVQARLAAVDAATGAVERSVARLEELAVSDMGYAVTAVIAMLGSTPELEELAWGELNRANTKTRLTHFLRIFSAARALAIARGRGETTTYLQRICDSWWLDESTRFSAVRTWEGVAYAYARDRTSVSPQLRPYQVVSIVECMRCLGRSSRTLDSLLVEQLRRWYQRADEPLRESFAEWSIYSDLVRSTLT